LNAVVLGIGFLGELSQISTSFLSIFPGGSSLSLYLMLRVYSFGGVMFCVILGVIGLIFSCVQCCFPSSQSRDNLMYSSYDYPYGGGSCYWIYCGPYYSPGWGYHSGPWGSPTGNCFICCYGNHGNCNCIGRGNHGSNDSTLVVVVVIIIILLIIIGLLFGIFLATLIVSKVIQRHVHVLEKQNACKIQYVVNLSDIEEVQLSDQQSNSEIVINNNNNDNTVINIVDDRYDAVKSKNEKIPLIV